jgi:hypothetical protein
VTPRNSTLAATAQFDAFLYAPIAEDSNGMRLSVLSALARLNVDPWDEAARLARLPCEAATRALTKLIAALPSGLPEGLDAGALARELVALLPRPGPSCDPSAPRAPGAEITIPRSPLNSYWVLYLVLMVIFFAAQWWMGR